MSTNLYWRPVDKQRLGYGLKFAIAPEIWDHDGSFRGSWATVGETFIPFLRGVAAGSKDNEVADEADRLIELIEQHGEVEVCLDD